MLALTRRSGEAIIINGNIKITIGYIEDGRVKVLIDAPKEVSILREELIERDQQAAESPGNQAERPAGRYRSTRY